MANGNAGKILRVNLTNRTISTLDTAVYEEFGGGFGMGAAIFWDLPVAPEEWDLQDAHDPRNVISLMAGPLEATGVPRCGRENERLRRIAGSIPHKFLLSDQFRRQIWHGSENCRMGRRRCGGQSRQDGPGTIRDSGTSP